jgi:hypothetical protein
MAESDHLVFKYIIIGPTAVGKRFARLSPSTKLIVPFEVVLNKTLAQLPSTSID